MTARQGFYASPKHLIDMYDAADFPFTEVHLFEPDATGMAVPQAYARRYNVSVHRYFVHVGTRNPRNDLISWLQEHVHSRDDWVTLKFDVDESKKGSTIEWGFLADLFASPAMPLVDELFIELHFTFASKPGRTKRKAHSSIFNFTLGWNHPDHSSWQAFDLLREMRSCGVAVHAWP